ncbi:MAG TPA: Rieske (2Fe-2S) protein [Pseudonocardiaceae bacterium]|nr:Rieske (2Fe-2S) protein [Pseudonocardiaceae bacterium]
MTTARTTEPAAAPSPADPSEPPATAEQALPDAQVSRRQWVRDVAIAGTVVAAGAGLAACSSSGPKATGPAPAPTRTFPSAAPPTSAGGSAGGSGGGAGSPTGKEAPLPSIPGTPESLVVTRASAIPVGGGVIYPAHGVVVTQPKAGTYKAFSSNCTHQGCAVTKVADGLIQCPCHGAKFSIVDGSVKAGPAPRPLPSEGITIQDGAVVLN